MRDGEYIQSIDVRFLKVFVPVKRLKHPIVNYVLCIVHQKLCNKR